MADTKTTAIAGVSIGIISGLFLFILILLCFCCMCFVLLLAATPDYDPVTPRYRTDPTPTVSDFDDSGAVYNPVVEEVFLSEGFERVNFDVDPTLQDRYSMRVDINSTGDFNFVQMPANDDDVSISESKEGDLIIRHYLYQFASGGCDAFLTTEDYIEDNRGVQINCYSYAIYNNKVYSLENTHESARLLSEFDLETETVTDYALPGAALYSDIQISESQKSLLFQSYECQSMIDPTDRVPCLYRYQPDDRKLTQIRVPGVAYIPSSRGSYQPVSVAPGGNAVLVPIHDIVTDGTGFIVISLNGPHEYQDISLYRQVGDSGTGGVSTEFNWTGPRSFTMQLLSGGLIGEFSF